MTQHARKLQRSLLEIGRQLRYCVTMEKKVSLLHQRMTNVDKEIGVRDAKELDTEYLIDERIDLLFKIHSLNGDIKRHIKRSMS